PLAGLAGLSPARRRLLVRHACGRLGLPSPPARRLESLLAQQAARPDAVPRVAWPGGEGLRWRGHLYLMAPPPALPEAWGLEWDGRAPLPTPLGSCPVALAGPKEGEKPLRVAPRRGGERLRLAGRGSRDLRRLLQELEVPPWVRGRLAVVWAGEAPVALLDPLAGRWLALAEGWSGA
ncbi:MAG: tRNA lysidine(34) synthetase TilS, partial [Halomonas sp.]